MVSRFHDAALEVCASCEGTVVERRNDGVLTVLGIPVAHEDDAQRALRAAADLSARVEQLPFGLRARSGVCTGEVVAASRPVDGARVIGEAVTVAEQLARAGAGGEIRLSESTWQVVRHAAHASRLADGSFRLESVDQDAPASTAGSTSRWSGGSRRSGSSATRSRASWRSARRNC